MNASSRLTATPQATVEDLDPPPALSLNPSATIDHALSEALSHDFTHLTIIDADTRALLGYLFIPQLQKLLAAREVALHDPVSRAMMRFRRRRGDVYTVIHMGTPLEDLEAFFAGENPSTHGKQDFAVVTDQDRKFLLGVATREDLLRFVERRPRP
jgi:CBS domain-containing protein